MAHLHPKLTVTFSSLNLNKWQYFLVLDNAIVRLAFHSLAVQAFFVLFFGKRKEKKSKIVNFTFKLHFMQSYLTKILMDQSLFD